MDEFKFYKENIKVNTVFQKVKAYFSWSKYYLGERKQSFIVHVSVLQKTS